MGRGERGEGEGEGRAQPVRDRVPLKASQIGKRHDSSGCPCTIMRPSSPRLGVVMIKGDMQHSDLWRETTFSCHDTSMTTKEARNAPEGRISKDLAHHAVIGLGRGSMANTVITLAGQGDMLVPKGGAAPPTPGQLSDKLPKLRNTDGKQPRRLLPGRTAATLVGQGERTKASSTRAASTRTEPEAPNWGAEGAP